MNTLFKLLFLLAIISFATVPLSAFTTDKELNQIYQRLIEAIGDKTSPFPELRRVQTTELVAGYSKRSNSIIIEEKALKVCEAFGEQSKDAIAFLLAHELTHFYQKHSWKEVDFGFLMTKKRFQETVAIEREADTYGAFILHLARYKIDVIPEIIPALYKEYDLLGENLSGYPSLKERQAVAYGVCKRVANLIHIFETANYLFAAGQFGEAAMSYEYLLKFVQCKELYANLGAACVAAVTTSTQRGRQNFIYPISIDANFPIRDASELEREELIKKALFSLKTAVGYDPTYYDAFINLACAHELNDDYRAVTHLLDQLQTLVRKKDQQAAIYIVQGIAAAHQNNKEAAVRFFDAAAKHKGGADTKEIAKRNKKILQGKSSQSAMSTMTATEQIVVDGIDLKYQPDVQFEATAELRKTPTQIYKMDWKQLKSGVLTQFESDQTWAFLQVNTKNIQTPKGIRIGSTSEQIKASYGEPNYYMTLSSGYLMAYLGQRLLFKVNSVNAVEEWSTFAVY